MEEADNKPSTADQNLFSAEDPVSHQKIVKGFLMTALVIAAPFLLVVLCVLGVICLIAFLNPQ